MIEMSFGIYMNFSELYLLDCWRKTTRKAHFGIFVHTSYGEIMGDEYSGDSRQFGLRDVAMDRYWRTHGLIPYTDMETQVRIWIRRIMRTSIHHWKGLIEAIPTPVFSS
jgi:hypothetical protein